jgi:hypothetical protein
MPRPPSPMILERSNRHEHTHSDLYQLE